MACDWLFGTLNCHGLQRIHRTGQIKVRRGTGLLFVRVLFVFDLFLFVQSLFLFVQSLFLFARQLFRSGFGFRALALTALTALTAARPPLALPP